MADNIPNEYDALAVDLAAAAPAPTYRFVLDWMQRVPGRAISFDYWARGNYLRRVIHNHN